MALVKEKSTVDILSPYNVDPLSFFYYDADEESNEALSARIDGITSGLSFGDQIIMQLPTKMGFRFDNAFIDTVDALRQNSPSKLIFYIHDDLLYDSSLQTNGKWIKLLNRADILIVNCSKTAQYLANLGVKRHQYSFFKICDILSDAVDENTTKVSNSVNLINEPKNIVMQVAKKKDIVLSDNHIHYLKTNFGDTSLPYRLAKNGGWVITWPNSEIDKICSSYQLGLALSAGLPIVAKAGTIEAGWAHDYRLGLVVDSLDQAVKQINEISMTNYLQYQNSARNLGRLSSKGFFTLHAIASAINNG